MDLVVGAAIGYSDLQLEPFLRSLRRFTEAEVVLLVDDLKPSLAELVRTLQVRTLKINLSFPPVWINVFRFKMLANLMANQNKYKRVLITDTRDVIFQADPFESVSTDELCLAVENITFETCEHNGPWYARLFGKTNFERVASNRVLCAGTTIGGFNPIKTYLDEMSGQLDKLLARRLAFFNCDQAVHNYVAYEVLEPNQQGIRFRFEKSGVGIISTLHYDETLTFDRNGVLLDTSLKPVPIVHQWDRAKGVDEWLRQNAILGSMQ